MTSIFVRRAGLDSIKFNQCHLLQWLRPSRDSIACATSRHKDHLTRRKTIYNDYSSTNVDIKRTPRDEEEGTFRRKKGERDTHLMNDAAADH